jgi:translocation protein SEC66
LANYLKMNWLSLLIPFAYLGILVASLATFSSLYRKRKAGLFPSPRRPKPQLNYSVAASLSLAPYFPPHTQRNIYLSLLHLSDDAGANEKAPKVPDSILRAALLARAQEDITRIVEIRTRKQALSTLLQRGVVGDEIWQRLLRAEQELELEVKDVVQEVWLLFPGRESLTGGASQWLLRVLYNYIHKKTNNLSLGKRFCAKLGPNHLPIRV